MLKKVLLSIATTITFGQTLYAVDQYHNFGEWKPDGHGVSDVGGFIDTEGKLGDKNNEYIFFRENNIGYIYKVEVNGDPNAHPDVNGEPVARRVFTYINKFPINHAYATGGEFYIDNTGIYYGSGRGIKKWNFNLIPQNDVATSNGISYYSDTLARNKTTGEWWTATGDRKVYKYNNHTNSWEYQFSYPSLAGSHHDGMEIINNQLFLSDMTSDRIIAYEINKTTGIVDDPTHPVVDGTYHATPPVEGMGFGPNKHFWMASGWGGTVYEIGEGVLRPTCSQTFHYSRHWQMSRSECDNIHVPAFDNTILVTYANNQLLFTTDDNGAYNWLQSHGYNVSRQPITLHSGEGFFTLGKYNIDKTIDNGELTNRFVNFHDGVYSLIGFSSAIDLNSKFANKPVDSISYYINGGWKEWTPANPNINNLIPANQAIYVLPDGDFGLLVK